jgi:uncharacterized MAPEG superfamily protein
MSFLGGVQQLSLGYLISSRDEDRSMTGMTARVKRALDNSVVALALFAPAILMLELLDRTNATSLLAAQVFLLARIIYLPVYALGVPAIRTLAWLAGFAATAILYFLAL